MSYGNVIKEERKKSKLTQVELAKKSDVSRTYLSDVENERYKPSVEFIKKISETLSKAQDVPIEEPFNKIMIATGYSTGDQRFELFCKDKYMEAKNLFTDAFVEENGAENINMIPIGFFKHQFEEGYNTVKKLNYSYDNEDEIREIFLNVIFEDMKKGNLKVDAIYRNIIHRLEFVQSMNFKYFYRPESMDNLGEMILKDGLSEKDYYYIQGKINEVISSLRSQLNNLD